MKICVAVLCDYCRSLLADPLLNNSPVQLRHVVCQARLTQALRLAATQFDAAVQLRGVRDESQVDEGRPLELTPWARSTERAAVRVGPRCSVHGCEYRTLSGEASGLGTAPQGFTIERIVEGDTFWFCPRHADGAERLQEQGIPADLICARLA